MVPVAVPPSLQRMFVSPDPVDGGLIPTWKLLYIRSGGNADWQNSIISD